jgi:hypothetical protein
LTMPLEPPRERSRNPSAMARLASTATNITIRIKSNAEFLVVWLPIRSDDGRGGCARRRDDASTFRMSGAVGDA